jgi:Sec-independent protein translocase protein TatA
MLAVAVVPPLAFIGAPGPSEILVLAVIALLLFGKDLPDVARQWGKAFNDFRRHLNGMRSELNEVIYAEPDRPKLQYHPEFHKRDPLPEAIPAEGNGDLTPDIGATSAVTAEHGDEPAPVSQVPSD